MAFVHSPGCMRLSLKSILRLKIYCLKNKKNMRVFKIIKHNKEGDPV